MVINMKAAEIDPFIRYVNNYSPSYDYTEHERIIYDYEFMFIMSGSVIMNYSGKRYELKKGDLFYLSPNVKNNIIVTEKDRLRTHCIHFDWFAQDKTYDFTAEEFYMHSVLSADHVEKEAILKSRPVPSPEDLTLSPHIKELEYAIFAPLFEKCYRAFVSASPASQLLAKAAFLEIISALICSANEKQKREPMHPAIARAVEFIKENYALNISESSLAEKYGFSPRYFGKIFRQSAGKSLNEFIMERRLFAAKEMLIGSDMTIAHIAEQAGFCDAFYFSKCFKKKEGLSPSDYRAAMRYI